MILGLTEYEKLKSVLDHAGTSASYDKFNLPAWRSSSWKVARIMLFKSNKGGQTEICNSAINFTLRG